MIETPIPDAPERPGQHFDKSVKERLERAQPVNLPVYSYQDLSALTPRVHENKMVFCSNGNSGQPCIALCDGFNWRVLSLGGNITL